jgi:GNAT superfamily N-acetyltransferase
MTIRDLDPVTDLDAVHRLYDEAADFWLLTDRKPPDRAKAESFFSPPPPVFDASRARRLGLFFRRRLVGVAELLFGFPDPGAAYLGLMVLAPGLRGQGFGPRFLAEVERLARAADAPQLYLAVLEENPRARAFWQRQGFAATGLSRDDPETGHRIHRLVKAL